jgi:hypothetical protein
LGAPSLEARYAAKMEDSVIVASGGAMGSLWGVNRLVARLVTGLK